MPQADFGSHREHFQGVLDLEHIASHVSKERHQHATLVNAEMHEEGMRIGLMVEEHSALLAQDSYLGGPSSDRVDWVDSFHSSPVGRPRAARLATKVPRRATVDRAWAEALRRKFSNGLSFSETTEGSRWLPLPERGSGWRKSPGRAD